MPTISMSLYRIVAIVLVGAMTTIAPVAHGSSPDPSWIAGIYDHADGDDAVQVTTDGVGFRSPATIPSDRVAPQATEAPVASFGSACSASLALQKQSRRPRATTHLVRRPPLVTRSAEPQRSAGLPYAQTARNALRCLRLVVFGHVVVSIGVLVPGPHRQLDLESVASPLQWGQCWFAPYC